MPIVAMLTSCIHHALPSSPREQEPCCKPWCTRMACSKLRPCGHAMPMQRCSEQPIMEVENAHDPIEPQHGFASASAAESHVLFSVLGPNMLGDVSALRGTSRIRGNVCGSSCEHCESAARRTSHIQRSTCAGCSCGQHPQPVPAACKPECVSHCKQP